MNNIEMLKNNLNLRIREVLAIIDMIDGQNIKYEDYEENEYNEEVYLKEQLILVNEIKTRLLNIFKE